MSGGSPRLPIELKRPLSPDAALDFIQRAIAYHEATLQVTDDVKGIKTAIRMYLVEATAEDDGLRKRLMAFLLGVPGEVGTKDLTPVQSLALRDWIDYAEMDGYWLPAAGFYQEVQDLLDFMEEKEEEFDEHERIL
jgi:hypothetical protein